MEGGWGHALSRCGVAGAFRAPPVRPLSPSSPLLPLCASRSLGGRHRQLCPGRQPRAGHHRPHRRPLLALCLHPRIWQQGVRVRECVWGCRHKILVSAPAGCCSSTQAACPHRPHHPPHPHPPTHTHPPTHPPCPLQPVVYTNTKNYTTAEVGQLLRDINLPKLVRGRKGVRPPLWGGWGGVGGRGTLPLTPPPRLSRSTPLPYPPSPPPASWLLSLPPTSLPPPLVLLLSPTPRPPSTTGTTTWQSL